MGVRQSQVKSQRHLPSFNWSDSGMWIQPGSIEGDRMTQRFLSHTECDQMRNRVFVVPGSLMRFNLSISHPINC